MALTINTKIINDADNYTADAKQIRGGYVSVATISERDNLPAATIMHGSLCYVSDEDKFYQYDGTTWIEAEFGGSQAYVVSATTQTPFQSSEQEIEIETSFTDIAGETHLVEDLAVGETIYVHEHNYPNRWVSEVYAEEPGPGRLPSAYQEVQYIQSDGNQYIDTGYTLSLNTKVQTKFKNLLTTGEGIFGTDGEKYRLFNFVNKIYWDYDRSSRIIGPENSCLPDTLYEFELGNNYVQDIPTETIIVTGDECTTFLPGTIKLNYYRDGQLSKNSWYYFKIYDSDVLVRDLVPCYRKDDNKPGMYDLVTDTFYTNANGSATTDFEVGPDINVNTSNELVYKAKLRRVGKSDGKIDDVKVNNVSVVTNKVANIDLTDYVTADDGIPGSPIPINADTLNGQLPSYYSHVSVNNTGTATDTVSYITINGVEKKLAGGSGGGTWGSITGTLSDQTDLQQALDAKQNSLTPQTEYVNKGTGTKVAQITTNNLGQVTNINEVDIEKTTLSDLGITATATEVNVLDGITATTTELNYVDGVTSSIQTQLNNKETADATILKQANVVDNVTSTSTIYPLSANQGKVLQTEINNLKNIGRFLAVLDCSNGTVTSLPAGEVGDTYAYKVGDYYRVGGAGTYAPKPTATYTIDSTSGSSNFEQGSVSYGIGDVIYCSNLTATTSTWVKQESSGGGKVQDVTVDGTSVVSGGIAAIDLTTPLATKQDKLTSANAGNNVTITTSTSGRLPEGYTELEYVESNGLQYINSGYNLSSGYLFEFKANFTSKPANGFLFGASSSGNEVFFGYNLSTNYLGGNFTYTWDLNQDYTILLDLKSTTSNKLILTVNDNLVRNATGNLNDKVMYLFGILSSSASDVPTGVGLKLYYFNVKDINSNYVMKLVPAKRNSDNVGGLYDLVSNTFLTNEGSGSLILGPTVGIETIKINATVPLEGVLINGTDLTITDKKVNIPIAGGATPGVVKVSLTNGINIMSGTLYVVGATDAEIEAKTTDMKPIVPQRLNKAIMEGLGNNSLTWTDQYKSNARTTLGFEEYTAAEIDTLWEETT